MTHEFAANSDQRGTHDWTGIARRSAAILFAAINIHYIALIHRGHCGAIEPNIAPNSIPVFSAPFDPKSVFVANFSEEIDRCSTHAQKCFLAVIKGTSQTNSGLGKSAWGQIVRR
jgi:hypothetical protein